MRTLPIWLKGCPRCGGDLFTEHEVLGWCVSCLQCGYNRWLELAVQPASEERLALGNEKSAA